ncbi:MAG: hypothetical protein RLW62_24755 [Gammaproteobacteria bacterium]
MILLLHAAICSANEALNGTWTLDAAASATLEEAGAAYSEELNERRRRNQRQTFDRDAGRTPRNRFDGQVQATTEMIEEDMRSHVWGDTPAQHDILGAATLKLYVARKVAVLYDGTLKRLLTINPAGRAYSVSGTEVTNDTVGRSLTYLEDAQLVIETSVHGGGRMTERYRVEDDGRRLVMQAELQESRSGPRLEFERVFTRAD